ncbi:ATP-binding cassette domain-containing protein, partial [Nonomuraea lactucae]|uniref:ATP-binding cassette domain-containing protein n=1 Tax=Nonomuraea lactucae TaxID=2249762 RepID=UPI000DE54733
MLRVDGLSVHAGPIELVREVSFGIAPGERVGLIGESGSGKSLTALSLLGLLPEGVTASGAARLGEHDLVGVPERRIKELRGRRISMVFQEPMTALNPLMRVVAQVAEVMTLHGVPAARARERAVELLGRVRLPR